MVSGLFALCPKKLSSKLELKTSPVHTGQKCWKTTTFCFPRTRMISCSNKMSPGPGAETTPADNLFHFALLQSTLETLEKDQRKKGFSKWKRMKLKVRFVQILIGKLVCSLLSAPVPPSAVKCTLDPITLGSLRLNLLQ